MFTRLSSKLLLLFLALASFQGMAEPQRIDRIIAVVNDGVVLESELNKRVQIISSQLQAQGKALPPEDVIKKQLQGRLVVESIQLQLAKLNKIHVSEQKINETVGNIIASNNVTPEQFKTLLKKDGFDYQDFRDNMRRELMISELHNRHIRNSVDVTQEEIDNLLKTEDVQGRGPVIEYRLNHIYISIPESASEGDIATLREKTTGIHQGLLSGDDFEQTAIAVSEGQTALEGGDLGWRKPAMLPSAFSEAALKLSVDGISDVIQTASGFHIIKLADKKGVTSEKIEQSLVRHILIKTSQVTSSIDAQRRLNQLRDRLDLGEDFATLAQNYSDDKGSGINGGELGWSSPGKFTRAFEEAIDQLAVNEVSQPFQSQFGWHIAQITEKKTLDDDNIKRRAIAGAQIQRRKAEEEIQLWLRRLRDEAYVEFRNEAGEMIVDKSEAI